MDPLIAPVQAPRSAWLGWLERARTSPRVAFLLRTGSTVLSAGFSLLWVRLLMQALGRGLYGQFLAFQAVAQLGGLGDFGLSGAMGVRVIGHLARGEREECRRFLAEARGVMALLALGLLLAAWQLAPWLPGWLGFLPLPGAGSLPLLFALGGLGVALMIGHGYFQNLNYVSGSVVWPILPAFLLCQGAALAQWLLARAHLPLWAQYLPTLAALALDLLIGWWMLRVAQPFLAEWWPVRLHGPTTRSLALSSLWVYLGSLGSLIYITTDRVVINAFCGPEPVAAYRFSYKLCELMMGFLGSASFVTLPAIVRRLLSPEGEERLLGTRGIERLQTLQILAACGFGLSYLLVNDFFIRLWVGASFLVPLSWQVAFALNLGLCIAGDTGVQLLGRLDEKAIRTVGLTSMLTALVNLGLSMLAARAGWILGVAGATVVAQAIATLVLNWHTCRVLRRPAGPWLTRALLLPMGILAAGAVVRLAFPPLGWGQTAWLIGCDALLLAVAIWLAGARWTLLQHEWERFRTVLR